MAEDVDDLASRLDRIEALLRRRSAAATPTVPAGPEVRSARSIVSRIDDVWVAVTEGNERVVAAIAALNRRSAPDGADPPQDREPSGAAAALARPELGPDPVGARLEGMEQALKDLREPDAGAGGELAGRLDAIEQRLAALAGVAGPAAAERLVAAAQATDDRLERIEDALATTGATGDDGAVHLRLNRIEEALAGIAERLAEPPAASAAGTGVAAAGQLHVDVRQLSERVEALAQAIEASAARSGDGTLTDRLGRLRDQLRR